MRAAERHKTMVMVAYRLHFEEANLRAIEIVNSGKIGEPRIFNSQFTMQARPENVRLDEELGGGALYDIGIYCINAARYLFRAEPIEVFAAVASSSDKRFAVVDEMVSAVMRFPDSRLAAFTCSFGAAHTSRYRGDRHQGRPRGIAGLQLYRRACASADAPRENYPAQFAKRDQFAALLVYFSNCILHRQQPEPSAAEGTIDVAIIEALTRSAKNGKPVKVKVLPRDAASHHGARDHATGRGRTGTGQSQTVALTPGKHHTRRHGGRSGECSHRETPASPPLHACTPTENLRCCCRDIPPGPLEPLPRVCCAPLKL